MEAIDKIRKGNTIAVFIPVLTGGEPVSLVGRNISVVCRNQRGGTQAIDDVDIDADVPNVIKFTVEGLKQDMCGKYRVIVAENANRSGQVLFDKVAFELVDSSDREDYGGGLARRVVQLSAGNLYIGGKDGTGIASMEQVTTSVVSGGQNVWRATLTDGSTCDFVVRNGQQGEPGRTPVKGTDYFTPEEIAAIEAKVVEDIEISGGVEWATSEEVDEICV